jgi:hypothetical protein
MACACLQDKSAGAAASAALYSRMCYVFCATLQDESAGMAAPGAAELSAMGRLAGPEGAATLAARRKALAQLRWALLRHAVYNCLLLWIC